MVAGATWLQVRHARYPVPLLYLTLLQGTLCAFPLLYSPFCSAPLHSGIGRRPERQTTCRMILVREIARNVVSYRYCIPVQYSTGAPPSLLKPRREPFRLALPLSRESLRVLAAARLLNHY